MAWNIRGLSFEDEETLLNDLRELREARQEADYETEFQRERGQDEISPVTYWSQVAKDALKFQFSKATTLIEARSMLVRLMENRSEDKDATWFETQELIKTISNELDRRAGSQARNLMNPIQERFALAQKNLEGNHFLAARGNLLGVGMSCDREQLEKGSARHHVLKAIERISGMKFANYCAKIGKDIETLRQLIEDTENEYSRTSAQRAQKAVERERQKVRDAAMARMDPKLVAKCREELARVEENVRLGNLDTAISLLVRYRTQIQYRDAVLAIKGRSPEEFFQELDTAIIRKRQERR